MSQPIIDAGVLHPYNGGMQDDNFQEEQKDAAEPQAQDTCGCDIPPAPEKEYAEAVDESDPEKATAATDELAKWRELALRTAAEYDNYRKRCVKERDEFTRYATRGLLEELLPVLDNFEMGMQMAEKEKGSMIYIGMEMVKKQLQDFLNAQGVEPIPAQPGILFDHNLHEAIQSEPSDQAEGTVPGYMLRGKLLRPVNVVTVAAPAPQN